MTFALCLIQRYQYTQTVPRPLSFSPPPPSIYPPSLPPSRSLSQAYSCVRQWGENAMLSMLALHAIVLGLCEKGSRHDAAPRGHGAEHRKRGEARNVDGGGGSCKKYKHSTMSPSRPHQEIWARLKPWQRFALMRDFFFAACRQGSIRRVKVKWLPLTQYNP